MARLVGWFIKSRAPEVFLMTGFSVIGYIFAVSELGPGGLARSFGRVELLYFVSVSFLVFAIYALNSAFGFKKDLANVRFSFLKPGDQNGYHLRTVLFLSISLLLGAAISLRHLVLYLAIFFLWAAYSWPERGLKSRPVAGTLCHFVAQILQFHTGSLLFLPPGGRTLGLSVYFALLFASGHLVHETIDYDADLAARVRTAAVKFGKERAERASFLLVVLAAMVLSALYLSTAISARWYFPFLFAFVFQAVMREVLRRRHPADPILYRSFYRLGYLAAGLVVVIL